MRHEPSRGAGLLFTPRRIAILIAYLLILFGVVAPSLRRVGQAGTVGVVLGALLATPPLLALLVTLIDEFGPVKNWATLFLLIIIYPALAVYHDVGVLVNYLSDGSRPTLWATLLLNATLLPATVYYGGKMVPRTCPNCHRRALILLMRLFKNDPRTSDTRWCACCGGKYWKDREGNWRVERRRTWLDAQAGPQTRPGPSAPAQTPSSRPPSRRETTETRPD